MPSSGSPYFGWYSNYHVMKQFSPNDRQPWKFSCYTRTSPSGEKELPRSKDQQCLAMHLEINRVNHWVGSETKEMALNQFYQMPQPSPAKWCWPGLLGNFGLGNLADRSTSHGWWSTQASISPSLIPALWSSGPKSEKRMKWASKRKTFWILQILEQLTQGLYKHSLHKCSSIASEIIASHFTSLPINLALLVYFHSLLHTQWWQKSCEVA